MTNKNAKQFVYYYNGIESSAEVEDDFDGEVLSPKIGDIIRRKGRNWKVVQVVNVETVGGFRIIPVVRVYLTDHN